MTYPFKIAKGKLHTRLGLDPEKSIPLKTIRDDLTKQRKALAHKATHNQALTDLREDQFALNAHRFMHKKKAAS